MGIFGKSKKDLLEWQKLVLYNSPNRVVLTEKQLNEYSYRYATEYLRIINDSINLCNNTKNPGVFFSRYDTLLDNGRKLAQLSKYYSFSGTSPEEAYNQAVTQKQKTVRELIDRCFDDTVSLKTESGKAKRFQTILTDFLPYRVQMDDANWNYLFDTCTQQIKRIISAGNAKKMQSIMEIISILNKYIIPVQNHYNMGNELTINPYFTDPSKTRLESQPLTETGRMPKYPSKLHYSTPDFGKRQIGDAWLFSDGSIGKAEMITWINHNGFKISLAIVYDELRVQRVETLTNNADRWQVLYKA